MQDIYIICALCTDGTMQVMRDFYSTQEYAMEAVKTYRENCQEQGKIFYYTVGNLVK